MAKKSLPRIDYLRKLLDYDPETGLLTWKPRTAAMCAGTMGRSPQVEADDFNNNYAGKDAVTFDMRGGNARTATFVQVGSWRLSPYHVAWALHYGEWARDEIDHINRDHLDNRIANLREATRAENSRNRTSVKGSSSRYLGVSWDGKKWVAQIGQHGTKICLGRFDDEEAAALAYDCAAVMMHREFANPNLIANPYLTNAPRRDR